MNLFLVESPGKVKTIQSFLPRGFLVKATVGHCFQIKSDFDIDFENNYKPKYSPCEGKQKVISELKKLVEEAEEVYVCTDGDREGSAIGKILIDKILTKKQDLKKVKRAIFTEITKNAVLKALDNAFDMKEEENLFHAQQARSVLDLLVGFKVSPVLWSKVSRGTSAGRVQSIGLRFIVERQREIDSFVPKEYWTIPGFFSTSKKMQFKALYHSKEEIPNETSMKEIEQVVQTLSDWYVSSIIKSSKSKSPYPVFNTSSLQQFCSSVFNWDGKQTMSLAQKLYEGGHITYHRTDSVNISEEALNNVKSVILRNYGKKYCLGTPRVFKSKNKVAQEAHEGIRPAHLERTLEQSRGSMTDQEFKLYKAIYIRFLACQMADAQLSVSKVVIKSKSTKHEFNASGQIIEFDGYLKAWKEYSNTKDEDLPFIEEKEKLDLIEIKPEQHFTKPSAAFNTATLVKVLEEEGIGRPSTYAGIIDTLLRREYIEKDGKSFKPTELGCKISDFLVQNFPELMDKKYTARIEEQLDEIANGEKVWHETVDSFYKELSKRITVSKGSESMKMAQKTDITCPTCKKHKLIKREGKYGIFFGCEGYMVKGKNKCSAIFKIDEEGKPVLKAKQNVRYLEGVVCDKCGSKIIIRKSIKTGNEFGGCSAFPKCNNLYNLDGSKIEFKKG